MIAEKPWRAESVLRLFLGIIMTVCFGLCLGGLLQSDKIGLTPDHREFAGMVTVAVFFQGGILVWIGIFLRETRLSWREAFGLEAFRQASAVRWGATAAVLFLPVALGMQLLSGCLITLLTHHAAAPQDLVKDLQNGDLPVGQQIFMGVLAVILAPPVEEMLFRGVIYPTIKQCGFPRAAVWLTSLLFAGMHFNELSFLPLTVFSMVLIFLYEKTGSLWASITAHSLFNFANFVLLMFTAENHPLIPPQ